MKTILYPSEFVTQVKELALNTIAEIVYERYSSKDNENMIGMVAGVCRLANAVEEYFKEADDDSGT